MPNIDEITDKDDDVAIIGRSTGAGGRGIVGTSETHTGTEGNSQTATGVWGSSGTGTGVYGVIVGVDGVGVYGKGPVAGRFEGPVVITGDLKVDDGKLMVNGQNVMHTLAEHLRWMNELAERVTALERRI